MAEHIDFDMLSLLPDNVKRKIFNGLCSGQSAAGSAAICYTDNFQEPPGGTCSSSTALLALDCKSDDADISSRLVHLPPLQLNGACIVDDVLSPAETSVSLVYMAALKGQSMSRSGTYSEFPIHRLLLRQLSNGCTITAGVQAWAALPEVGCGMTNSREGMLPAGSTSRSCKQLVKPYSQQCWKYLHH